MQNLVEKLISRVNKKVANQASKLRQKGVREENARKYKEFVEEERRYKNFLREQAKAEREEAKQQRVETKKERKQATIAKKAEKKEEKKARRVYRNQKPRKTISPRLVEFQKYVASNSGKVWQNKSKVTYSKVTFPTGFRYMSDFVSVKNSNIKVDFELIDGMMKTLSSLENDRKILYVILWRRLEKNKEIEEKTSAVRPDSVVEALKSYNETLLDFKFIVWQIAEVPNEGACDTRPHDITMKFGLDNDKMLELKVSTVKSSGDNCLINALSQANGTLGKAFRARKVREELLIPAGGISTEFCQQIAQKLQVTYALYKIDENKLVLISESETKSEKHVDLLLQGGHYYKIVSDVRQILAQQPKESMQIQDNSEVFEKVTDNVVNFENAVEEQDLDHVDFSQTIENPTTEEFLELVKSKKNVLLIGAGGCGKTWLLKKMGELSMVRYTATTACAAELLNGVTIQSYILKNRKPTREVMIVDEVSMMGSMLFEQLYEWTNKGKKDDHAQLILSGDFLQLPPVNDRFFFQASSFFEFAKNAVMVKLTEVKRQENKDQADFLNNLRVGNIDWQYVNRLTKNQVHDPQLVLSAKKDFVAEYNEFKLKSLGYPLFNYEGTVYKKNGTEKKVKNQLCVGAKAIITKNMIINDSSIYNGMRVTVTAAEEKSVQVIDEKGKLYTINYTTDEEDGKVVERYLPVEACYALTIHKSQGQTVDSCIVHCDGVFEEGMMYVALSRCRDLKNLRIEDKINRQDKGWQPNSLALEFYKTGKTISADQMLFIPDTKKQLKGVRRHTWKQPNWNHIYIDFETCVDGQVTKPYYNHLLHMHGEKEIAKLSFFDQRWEGGERCNVAKATWEYVQKVALAYGDNLASCKGDKTKIALVKKLKNEIPTLIGFNLSGFDLHFLMQQYLNDPVCSARFKLNMIYKGTSLIFFQVFDRISQEIVLRTHDVYQIVTCSLSKALTDFCGQYGKELAKKIEFKDEIMYIYHNYTSNPEILKPGVVSDIKKKVYTGSEVVLKDLGKKVCLYDEVIRYADNDTQVLPILYKALDQVCKETLDANVDRFLTAGSMAWYGFVSNISEECQEISHNKHGNRTKKGLINTKLYRSEKKQEEFIRSGIKGGRVCPRQHTTIDGEKYVYLDISGMYASIMRQEILPYGKSLWMDERETKILDNTVREIERGDWRQIYESLTKRFGMFMAEVDFEENKHNLEPVIQFKDPKYQGKTRYTLERRTDTITSIDLALIIASGGKIHEVKRALCWESNNRIMEPWIRKCNELKKEGELSGNSAKKAFGKLLANSAYGQTLKADRNEVVKIVSTWQEADYFVNTNKLTDIFQCGEFDVLKGQKKVSQESFITSRCSFIGAFILGYTRAMVFEICEIACPNRYNKKGVDEQPVYGDTDSLVFREWQANLLVQAGWVQKSNGRLTDELADDKAHWFLPPRISQEAINMFFLSELPFVEKQPSIAQQQDNIWSNATEEEKRDPANFKFLYVTKGIFSAPKSYACEYTNHYGYGANEKIKFKGIPTTALVDAKKLDFSKVEHAYSNPGTKTAVLQGAPQILKTFTKAEGNGMFSQVVDSNLRRDKPVSRILFKTTWQGRHQLKDNKNVTVPWGWTPAK